VPYVTIGLIALNVLVFLWEVFSPLGMQRIVFRYGAVPVSLLSMEPLPFQHVHPAASVFTAMFLHGGLFHVGGNMLYLWIFGDNIEARLGHCRFLLFYLLSGIAAAYAHSLSEPTSTIPMIGASGAVSGVLGAYLLLYPRAQVYTLVFFGFFYQVIRLPALIVIGFWAIIQFVNGLTAKALMGGGGVAWFAHLGGFLFGLLVVRAFIPRARRYFHRGWW